CRSGPCPRPFASSQGAQDRRWAPQELRGGCFRADSVADRVRSYGGNKAYAVLSARRPGRSLPASARPVSGRGETAMNPSTSSSRLSHLRGPLLAAGIALSTFAAAQSAPEAPVNPELGPAFATKNAAYVPVLFDEIPGWEDESFEQTYTSFSTNCKAMKRRASWAPICARLARLPKNDEALRAFIRDEFYAYQMLTPTRSA